MRLNACLRLGPPLFAAFTWLRLRDRATYLLGTDVQSRKGAKPENWTACLVMVCLASRAGPVQSFLRSSEGSFDSARAEAYFHIATSQLSDLDSHSRGRSLILEQEGWQEVSQSSNKADKQ